MDRADSSRRQFLTRVATVAGSTLLVGCLDGRAETRPPAGSSTVPPATPTVESTSTPARSAPTATRSTSARASQHTSETSIPTTPRLVSFRAPHRATIQATVYGDGDCGVVLVPQIDHDRESWQPQAERLATQGYHVLAIDEDPDDRASSVRGAIRYLRELGVTTLVLVGASSGGRAVVTAAAETDAPVDGVVTLSAAGGTEHADALGAESLFVVTTGDDDRFVRTARDLDDAASNATLVTYDGSAHGQAIFDTHGEALDRRLRRFLSTVCTA